MQQRRSPAIISFMALIAGLAACLGVAAQTSYHDVSAAEALQMQANKVYFLDVRSFSEFQAGHIPGAVNIDVNELDARIAEINDKKAVDVLVYCLSGIRSVTASNKLTAAGFTKVHNMAGGFNAWRAAGYEYETGSSADRGSSGCMGGTVTAPWPTPPSKMGGDILMMLGALLVLIRVGTLPFRRDPEAL